jgi:hypothetical protein
LQSDAEHRSRLAEDERSKRTYKIRDNTRSWSMAVLSHLTMAFSASPENLATEALAYILQRSSAAQRGMLKLVESLSGRALPVARFETQFSNDDNSRPDLVGMDVDGKCCLSVEVKFWAGLTAAQPVAYLNAMPGAGVLLFVAPEARLAALWAELRRRVSENLLATGALNSGPPFSLSIGTHVLALTSWRVLLARLESDAEAAAEVETAADIRQLQALCDNMDTDAFLPLSSEELTSGLGRRVVQFQQLTDDLTNQLVDDGIASVAGLRAAAGWNYSGRYLRLRGNAAFLKFDAKHWADWGLSPIWLDVWGAEWKPKSPAASVQQALRDAGIDFQVGANSSCVPIRLPMGVERNAVIAEAARQLMAIAQALPEVAPVPAQGLPQTE